MHRPTLFFVAVFGMAPSAHGQIVCPTSCARAGGFFPNPSYDICTTAAVFDSCATVCAGFDLRGGTFHLNGTRSGGSVLELADDFRIQGPVSPNLVPFQIEVHLVGELWPACPDGPKAYTRVTVQIREGASNELFWDSTTNCEENYDLNRTLVLSGARPVGQNFRFSLVATAGASVWALYARVQGTYRVVGLPAGYTLTSCQGLDSTVGVAEESWGGVKALYR